MKILEAPTREGHGWPPGGRPRGIDIIDQQDLLPLNLLWFLDGKGILEVLELLWTGRSL